MSVDDPLALPGGIGVPVSKVSADVTPSILSFFVSLLRVPKVFP
jgi:hypothetical protein